MVWIDEIILGLSDTYGTNDPYNLCDLLGIQIIKINRNELILQKKNSVYIRNFNNNETIFIRDDLRISYQKFYLLHELGHAILHTDIMCSYHNYLTNYDKIERQANYFAFKLSDTKIDLCECDGYTISQIASYIEVPENVLIQIVGER